VLHHPFEIQKSREKQKGGGAVSLVIVRHRLTARQLDRLAGFGAIQRLEIALVSSIDSTTT